MTPYYGNYGDSNCLLQLIPRLSLPWCRMARLARVVRNRLRVQPNLLNGIKVIWAVQSQL
jgi:hypothetical protein